MSLRAGIAKIECYRVVAQTPAEGGKPREVRSVSHRLVLPVEALNELHWVLRRSQDLLRKAREGRPHEASGQVSSDPD